MSSQGQIGFLTQLLAAMRQPQTGSPTPATDEDLISVNVQPYDADLSAIAGLSGTSGLLRKTGLNTWVLDTSNYLTTVTNSQVTAALGYTPVTDARTLTINGVTYDLTANRSWTIASGVTSFNTRTGAITLLSSDITSTLGYTPYNASNPAGYISSFTETDPTVGSHIKAITTTNISNWNTAYGWGNHASAGYLTGITSGQVTTALGYTPENLANKGIANGYASLDGSGLVPSTQLPSYVDDVLEYANLAGFPATGTTGKIYVALDTNKIYRWSGSAYIEVSPTVGTIWGGITGTLANQTDLQTALNAKQATLNGTGFVKSTAGVISYDTNTYLTGNQSITISGDASGTGSTAISLTLASVGTAGTYRSVTTDAKGRVTAGTNPTTISEYGITDFYSQVISGFVVGANSTVTTTDTLETAIEKLQGQVNARLSAEADTLSTVTGRGATTSSAISLTNATATTSAATGALIVSGGIGVAGSVFIGTNLTTGGFTMGQGITNQNILLTINNPGIGFANGFSFLRGTDGAGIRVIETANDAIMYEIHMSDNPDSSSDMIQLRYTDWQSPNGLTVPIQVTGRLNRYVAQLHTFYGGISQNTTGFFTTSNFGGTNGTDTQLIFNDVTKLRTVGSSISITALNTNGLTASDGSLFWIKLDTATTFAWGYGSAASAAVVSGIALSTSPTTLSNGIQVTFSATTGTIGDTFSARVFKAPTNSFANITASSFIRSGGTSAQFLKADGSVDSTGYTTNTGTVTSVSGTGTVSGLSLSGTVTTTGNLTLGGTLAVTASNFSSQTANTFLAGPNGTAGVPTFRSIVAADIPTLNQNTSGSAGSVTNSLVLRADTGTTEGTDLYTYNGSAAKNLNIVAGSNITITKVAGQWTIAGSAGGTLLNGTGFVRMSGTTASYITGTSSQFVKADGTLDGTAYYAASNPNGYTTNTGTVTSVAALTLGTTGTDLSSTVATGTTTPVITLNVPTASATNRGALSSTDWSTFNNKQATISLTTTGSSGAATFSANTLNIPNYTLSGLGGQPLATNLTSLAALSYVSASFVKMTAAGTFALDTNTYYLASNPSGYTTNTGTVTSVSGTGTVSGLTLSGSVTTSGSLTLGGTLSLASLDITTALGYTPYNSTNPNGYITGITSGNVTTALGYTPVTNARTLTINGTAFDLSADRSWTISAGTTLNGTGFVKASGTTITYDNSTYYLASNPSGYTTNTGTVTSVGGTGSYGGLTLSGTVTTSGNLTLGGTPTGTWPISVSGSAASATSATSATSSTNIWGPGGSYIASQNAGTSYSNHIQIREAGLAGAQGSNGIYAPALGFHWSGVVASNIVMEASGRIVITNNPGTSYEAFAAAAITCTSLTETSSKRYKENISSLDYSLPAILKLEPVSYNRIGESKKEIGFIAEDVESVVPEVIEYNYDGEIEGISYGRLTSVLINAVKEQQKQIDELKALLGK